MTIDIVINPNPKRMIINSNLSPVDLAHYQ